MNALRRGLLIFLAAVTLAAPRVVARAGGGCLEAGTLVATPHGLIAIEQLQVGDTVWGWQHGARVPAQVQALYAVEATEYLELQFGGNFLRLTADHPVEVSAGVFLRADRLQVGDVVRPSPTPEKFSTPQPTVPLSAIRTVRATRPAYNLMVSPGGVFFAAGIAVHNKGCFLPDTPVTLADGSQRAISAIQPGDAVLAFAADGAMVRTRVRKVLTHSVESYLVLRTATVELHVTEEHPFYVGDGRFKTAESLQLGEAVWVFDRGALAPQPVLALERVASPVAVFNLQTENPHTFLANGVAVHNKGGGCFVAGTLVATPDGPRPIETLRLGELVLAPESDGGSRPVPILGLYQNFARRRTLITDRGPLHTTDEHPLQSGSATEFLRADSFAVGASLARADGVARILAVTLGTGAEPVYTLSVAAPHAFLADGFVVHNKGGGSRSSRSSSRGGGGASVPLPPGVALFIIFGFTGAVLYAIVKSRQEAAAGELDHVFDRSAIEGKAVKTRKLLEFISKVDAAWDLNQLRQTTRAVFLELQKCWANRDYAPVESLMMRDLFEQHSAQLRGLRQTHEINRITDLQVELIDLVHVNYTQRKEGRFFTAAITASGCDQYFDDRTGEFLRGDTSPQQFQEFWTFQWLDGWKLRDIEQAMESDALSTENYFEPFTETGRDQVYGEAAGETGPAGPALPPIILEKGNKIDRLLNFLVQTDRIWSREDMLATARRVFLNVQLAWQDGRPEMVAGLAADPALLAHLQAGLATNQQNGLRIEHRNLCVRKAEIVHVNNRDDRKLDSFTARISAHAQTIVTAGSRVLRRDEHVRAWTEFWTFGRDGQRWVLREILPEATGVSLVAQENVDEGTSQQMLEWYYSKPRAT